MPESHIWPAGQGTRSEQRPHSPETRLQVVPSGHIAALLSQPQVWVAGLHRWFGFGPQTAGVTVQSGMHTPSLGARPSGSGMHT